MRNRFHSSVAARPGLLGRGLRLALPAALLLLAACGQKGPLVLPAPVAAPAPASAAPAPAPAASTPTTGLPR